MEPMNLTGINCSAARVAQYQGLFPPHCNNGAGCSACWDKFQGAGSALRRMAMANKRRQIGGDVCGPQPDAWPPRSASKTFAEERYGETYDE